MRGILKKKKEPSNGNGRAIIFYKQRISDTNDKGYFMIVE